MAASMTASLIAPTAVVAKAAPSKASLARLSTPAAPTFALKTRSNGVATRAMLVWTPINNKFFETFSYLPPLSDSEISKQVDYIVNNGFIPSLEFAMAGEAYIESPNTIRMGGTGVTSGYFDNRYWTMYKLPMFGCSDPSQVLTEIKNCTESFPEAYIRLVAFDQVRQVQCAGFLVHRPPGASEFTAPEKRSI
jgi:ribulose-bisphosphate carboxylase small chain